jgi:hypothetical protein
MSYLKGKDIKIPFDCLWYYYTRKFEVLTSGHSIHANGYEYDSSFNGFKNRPITGNKPEGFEKW